MFVTANKINFSYDQKTPVITEVSFNVNKGEVLAIVGASGSGKSTILRMLAGILPLPQHPHSSIHIDGHTPSAYLKLNRLAFMFQQPTLFPNLTVRENVELPYEILNEKNSLKATELIDTVGLRDYEHYLPKDLSGGMKTRVALARSFATEPELLLLDEPFSSLDVAWKDVLYQELKSLIKNFNTTVVLVTHDIQEALELADNIICLGSNGRLLLEKKNTRSAALYSLIHKTIISDHEQKHENN